MSSPQQSGSTSKLLIIERELKRGGLRMRFNDRLLERTYAYQQRERARLHNRITLCLLIAIFDAFIVTERNAIPEALGISALLRFALITPATLIYVILDWRGVLKSWNAQVITCLMIAPTLLAFIESFWVVSPMALANYQAVPLIQLAVLTCRISVPQALLVNVSSCLFFAATVLNASFIPSALHGSLIMTDLAIGMCTLVFAWRLELRDRQVFLFTQQAALGRDILARQNRKLARLTQVDALTGLGNRRCFDDAIVALWAPGATSSWPISLIMFDIDCFKQYNDSLGHQAGDECLATVARTVSKCLRDERDTLVRYGGEEFAIILPRTGLDGGHLIAERVRQAVLDRAIPHPGGGPLHLVTVSLGVASAASPDQSAASLIEQADRCLYAAKRRGRNQVESDGLHRTPSFAGDLPMELPARQHGA